MKVNSPMNKKKIIALMVFVIAAVSFSVLNEVPAAVKKNPAGEVQLSPVDLKNVSSLILIFKTSPEAIRALVPRPLVPNKYNVMSVAISRISFGEIDYHEMVLGALVEYRGELFTFSIARIVDHEAASARNQALYGTKSPVGRISLERKKKNIKGTVEVDGRVLVSAELKNGSWGGNLNALPLLSLREIPPARKGARPTVKQLVLSTVENMKERDMFDGTTYLRIDYPMPGLSRDAPVVEVVRGVYREADFTVKPGGVLYDFIKKK